MWVVCQGDPGNSGYTCNLGFLSVISLWLILEEEFRWKKSFNKARTIFSLSRHREGHHLCFCVYPILIFIICASSFSICITAWPWACAVTSISLKGTHQGRFVWLRGRMVLRWRSQGKGGGGTVEKGNEADEQKYWDGDVRLVDRVHKVTESDFLSLWMTCVSSPSLMSESIHLAVPFPSHYQRFTALLLTLTDDFAGAGQQSEEFLYSNQFSSNKSNWV